MGSTSEDTFKHRHS